MDNDLMGRTDDSQFINFQDFSPINRSNGAQLDLGTPNQQQFGGNFTNQPPDASGMMEDLQDLPHQQNATESKNFWTIEYYQKFFNVNTKDVISRIKNSMVPSGDENYLLSTIRPNPDLYGPFWICITLIFAIAIAGNLASYIQTANSDVYHWKYEFHIVSYAATVICVYVWLLPLGLWAAIKWTKAAQNNTSLDTELIEENQEPGLLELLCLYGYSLSIFIPVAFLWTVQIYWLQWLFVGIAGVLSGGVLVRSLLPVIIGKQKPIYIAVIFGMHLILATGFMLYFFHMPDKSTQSVSSVTEKLISQNLSPTNQTLAVISINSTSLPL